MEADSTTFDNSIKDGNDEPNLPFNCLPRNLVFYKGFTTKTGEKSLEFQIVERLKTFGLLPNIVKCPTDGPNCKVVSRAARVIDRVQWICEGCSKRLPIRSGSFFLRLQCSILQALQLILAWCEDADLEVATQHFGIKSKVASTIYDRLDELAVKEQSKLKLGGEDTVVLTEMYPDCLTRLSPDTTDQPHVHRILMIADTKYVPTRYYLHVIKQDLKKTSMGAEGLQKEMDEVLSQKMEPGSILVTGNHMPGKEGAATIQQLVQHCDADMQHFLTSRVWRQAVSLCLASRDLCAGAGAGSGAGAAATAVAAQRYLLTALYRLQHGDGFFEHTLGLLADEFTDKLN